MTASSKRPRSDSQWEWPLEVPHDGKLYHRQNLVGGISTNKRSPWWTHGVRYCVLLHKDVIAGWMCSTEGCHMFVITTNQSAGMAQRHTKDTHIGKKQKTTKEVPSIPTDIQTDTGEGISQTSAVFRRTRCNPVREL